MQELKKPQDNQQREFEFLHAELPTGLTFSAIALTATYPGKKKRNTVNAGKPMTPRCGSSPGPASHLTKRQRSISGWKS
jgi:hypothetical protein